MSVEHEIEKLQRSVRRCRIAAGFAFALAAATVMMAVTQPDDPYTELLKQNIKFATEPDGHSFMHLRQNVIVSGNLYTSGSLVIGRGGKSRDRKGWQWHFLNHPKAYPALALTYQEGDGEKRVFRAIFVKEDKVQDLTFDESTAPEFTELLAKPVGDG